MMPAEVVTAIGAVGAAIIAVLGLGMVVREMHLNGERRLPQHRRQWDRSRSHPDPSARLSALWARQRSGGLARLVAGWPGRLATVDGPHDPVLRLRPEFIRDGARPRSRRTAWE